MAGAGMGRCRLSSVEGRHTQVFGSRLIASWCGEAAPLSGRISAAGLLGRAFSLRGSHAGCSASAAGGAGFSGSVPWGSAGCIIELLRLPPVLTASEADHSSL